MARGDGERIDDILAAIAAIRADTAGMDYPAFARTPLVVRSVLYSIGVIGEAAKGLSPEIKAATVGNGLSGEDAREWASPSSHDPTPGPQSAICPRL